MPDLRIEDEGQRDDEGGDEALALPEVRSLERAQDRQQREDAGAVPAMAVLQRRDSRPRDEQGDVLAQDLLGVEALADSALTGEVHDVVHLDGIWLRRKAVVLIAVAGGYVVGWHLARSESASAWAANFPP